MNQRLLAFFCKNPSPCNHCNLELYKNYIYVKNIEYYNNISPCYYDFDAFCTRAKLINPSSHYTIPFYEADNHDQEVIAFKQHDSS